MPYPQSKALKCNISSGMENPVNQWSTSGSESIFIINFKMFLPPKYHPLSYSTLIY